MVIVYNNDVEDILEYIKRIRQDILAKINKCDCYTDSGKNTREWLLGYLAALQHMNKILENGNYK